MKETVQSKWDCAKGHKASKGLSEVMFGTVRDGGQERNQIVELLLFSSLVGWVQTVTALVGKGAGGNCRDRTVGRE